MRKRVPLNAIRAFEAVARNTSVAKAADELCVTPTAVSHQIRLLEDFLQTELFVRTNSRMYLTPNATSNLAAITNALDLIEEAVQSLNRTPRDIKRSLVISASASVASMWLMPRIRNFLEREPNIDLSLSTYISRKEAETRECDFRISNWHSPGDAHVDLLFEEEVMPVCHPSLAARYGNDPKEILLNAPLIHIDRNLMGYEGTLGDWSSYFNETGLARKDFSHGLRCNISSSGVEAARAGLGVLLGRALLVESDLANGELIQIGNASLTRSPYFLISAGKPEARQRLQGFKEWLLESIRPNQMLHAC